jgi:hypothetical protein
MRELELDEIRSVEGGLGTFVRLVGGAVVRYILSGDNSGTSFEQGDPSIVSNVYGA